VDVLEDADGQLFVLEVNHRPEFRWTQQAAGPDIAAAIIEWVRGSA
jgi:glutathione synthase/RimK-type ligase-like ATP-grasp enzyme